MYFQWRKSRGSSEKFHGAVVDHDRSENNRVFKDVSEVGKALEKMDDIVATMPKSEVAVLYDWDNNWALGDAQGFGRDTKRYPQTVQQHYQTFWKRDIQVDVISKEQDFSKYKLLVVPMLYMMSESLIQRFKDFVAAGGRLVTTYISGLVDESDLTHMSGWPAGLQEIFGLNVLETDTYYPKDKNAVTYGGATYEVRDYATVVEVSEATTLGVYEEDFYAGSPAVTKHAYSQGFGYFIGARLEEDFHDAFYGKLLGELGIESAVRVSHGLGVTVQVRESESEKFVFVMNFTESIQPVELHFEGVDMLSGEVLSGNLELPIYGVRVIRVRK